MHLDVQLTSVGGSKGSERLDKPISQIGERFEKVAEHLKHNQKTQYTYPEVGTAPELEDSTPEEQQGILDDFIGEIAGAELPVPGVVLDAGCGIGRLTPVLHRTFSYVISLDADGRRLAVAEKRHPKTNNHQYINVPIDHPALLDPACESTMACIFCIQVFGHLPHDRPARIMRAFHHVLEPEGYLVLAIPFANHQGPPYEKVVELEDDFKSTPISGAEFEELASRPRGDILPVRRFNLNDIWVLLKDGRFTPRVFRDYQWAETGGDILILAQK